MNETDINELKRQSDWSPLKVCVAGLGIAGIAAADALVHLGAQVTMIDGNESPSEIERARLLEILGARLMLGDDAQLPADVDLLVVSPGIKPDAPIVTQALAAEIPVWGELELAWRLRDPENLAPWLVITGTNGKTTTTLMLESILQAAGLRTVAAGNIGVSLVEVMMHPEPLDVVAIEVGAPQLPFVYSMSPLASVCLNLAQDHLDFFGTFEAYRAAKARIYERTHKAAIYNSFDQETIRMVEDADVIEGCRAIGLTLGIPSPSSLGVVDDIMVDRAFLPERKESAHEMASIYDLPSTAPHNVFNALAASALARAFDVSPLHIKEGLRKWQPALHRITHVAHIDGVDYIDDSKATNTHAARTSLMAFESVVWIAGGLAKGQKFDELISACTPRLKGVVLLGVDQQVIAEALKANAPHVPVRHVTDSSVSAMQTVVRLAAELADEGDTVLLAPGCASWDMFKDYGHRGEAFAHAVQEMENK